MNGLNQVTVVGYCIFNAVTQKLADGKKVTRANLIWVQHTSKGRRNHLIECVGFGEVAERMLKAWTQWTGVLAVGRLSCADGARMCVVVESFEVVTLDASAAPEAGEASGKGEEGSK